MDKGVWFGVRGAGTIEKRIVHTSTMSKGDVNGEKEKKKKE